MTDALPATLFKARCAQRIWRTVLARKIGVTNNTLWNWESENTNPSIRDADKWAEALGYEITLREKSND